MSAGGGQEKIADQAMSLVSSLERAYRRLNRPADGLPRAGGARNLNSSDLQIINKYKNILSPPTPKELLNQSYKHIR